MNSKQINELLASENHSTAIAELKNGRNATEPNAAEYIAQLDPQGHDVNDSLLTLSHQRLDARITGISTGERNSTIGAVIVAAILYLQEIAGTVAAGT